MSKVVDLLGYKYAKSVMKQDEHTFDALRYLFAKQMQKKTISSSCPSQLALIKGNEAIINGKKYRLVE
jgi:hypothetical protein